MEREPFNTRNLQKSKSVGVTMTGYERSGNTLYYTYPNGKTIMVGQSKLLENYDKIMSQFKYGKKSMEEEQLSGWNY